MIQNKKSFAPVELSFEFLKKILRKIQLFLVGWGSLAVQPLFKGSQF